MIRAKLTAPAVSALVALGLALAVPLASEARAAPPVSGGKPERAVGQQLREWRGEHFDKKQGAIYLKVALKNFKASKQSSTITSDVAVEIVNLLRKKTYVFIVKLQDLDAPPRQLYKLPSGKYAIKSVTMVDAAGSKRRWQPEEQQTFTVKRLCVSNLGIWDVQPQGKDGLLVAPGSAPNSYVEGGKKKDSSVAAVLDGFTGLVQETFAGRKLFKAAEGGFAGKSEMRATITFTRQIAMFYRLDLLKHNYHAKAIATVLSVYDPNMRTCYTNRLEFNDKLKGDVSFTFLLSKSSGTMAKIKNTGGTANDPKLVECMYYELGQIQFPVPENMIGELTYTYDVR